MRKGRVSKTENNIEFQDRLTSRERGERFCEGRKNGSQFIISDFEIATSTSTDNSRI